MTSAQTALKTVATGKPAATTAASVKDTFSNWITGPGVQAKISSMMKGEKGDQFTTALVSAVSLNPALARCERGSILSSALQGAALGLSPSPSMGHFFLVPYGNNSQFQLGYKGLIQLAMRSGKYKHLTACDIRDGELKGWNPLTEELTAEIEEDDAVREALPIIGYVARFELLNGFSKTVYWSRKRVESHGRRYSKSFGKSGTPWQTNFDAMALKTALRDLIGHWGPMSIEMERGFRSDMGVIAPDGSVEYVDAPSDIGEAVEIIDAPSTEDMPPDAEAGIPDDDARLYETAIAAAKAGRFDEAMDLGRDLPESKRAALNIAISNLREVAGQ
jgi:recombination protein RecT